MRRLAVVLPLVVALQGAGASAGWWPVRTITGFSNPVGIAVDPGLGRAYVSSCPNSATPMCSGGRLDTFYEGDTSILTSLSLPSPVFDAVNPSSHHVYVSNISDGSVSIVDGSSMTLLNSVALPRGSQAQPHILAVDPARSLVFVAAWGLPAVQVIDDSTATPAIAAQLYLPGGRVGSTGVAYDPHNQHLYVSERNSNFVDIYDTNNMVLVTSVRMTSNILDGIAVDPTTDEVYVPEDSSVITYLDGNSGAVLGQAMEAPGPFIYCAVDSADHLLLAPVRSSSSSSIDVFDAGTGAAVGDPLPVGSTPEVVAVDPTTQLAFVTNNAGNSVTLLQLDQNPPSVAFDTRSGATLDSGVPTVPSNHVTGTAQSALVGIDHVYVTYVPLGLAQTSAVFGPIPAYVKCSDNTLEWCTFDSTPPSIPGSYTVQAIAVDRTGSASAASSIQVTIV